MRDRLEPVTGGPATRGPAPALIGTVATLSMTTAAIPAYAVGVLAPFLVPELGLDPATIGVLIAVGYGVGAGLSPLAGSLVDRRRDRLPARSMLVGASAAIAGIASAPGVTMLLVAMVVAGLALALANPVTNHMLHAEVPPRLRGPLSGIKQAGVPLAWLVVGVQLALTITWLGWRGAAVGLLAVPLLTLAASVALGAPAAAVDRRAEHAATPPAHRISAVVLVFAVILGIGASSVAAYLPLTAVELTGIRPTAAGYLAGTVGAAGVLGRLGWGWASMRIERLHLAMAALAIGALLAGSMVALSPGWPALIWLGAALFGMSAVSGMVLLTVLLLRIAGPDSIGRATGWVSLAFFGGFVPGPLLMGTVIASPAGYRGAWLTVAAVFALGAVLPLIASTTTPMTSRH